MTGLAQRAFVLISLSTTLTSASLLRQSPTEPLFFSKVVYPALQGTGCNGCHAAAGLASATLLRVPTELATAENIEVFGRRLVSLIDRTSLAPVPNRGSIGHESRQACHPSSANLPTYTGKCPRKLSSKLGFFGISEFGI